MEVSVHAASSRCHDAVLRKTASGSLRYSRFELPVVECGEGVKGGSCCIWLKSHSKTLGRAWIDGGSHQSGEVTISDEGLQVVSVSGSQPGGEQLAFSISGRRRLGLSKIGGGASLAFWKSVEQRHCRTVEPLMELAPLLEANFS